MKNPNFVFYKEDIRNREGIFDIFEKEHPDIVVNFAAESHVDRSIENPGIFLETNILGTQVMMDACRKYGVERFHQVGTDEVYGDLPLDRPDLFFHEDTPIHTSSPYSTSKASADLLTMAYHRTYGLPVTISRCSNNYGPYQFPEKLIPLMINNASQDKALPVYGEGLNVRDWLYVKDHCYGILAVLEKGKVGEVYNLGGHNEKANIEIVKIILKELDKPESLITYVTDRKGHDKRYAIDPSKANAELGWGPTTMFAGWCSTCLICLYQPFMRIWMGEQMMLPNVAVVLFVVYFYLLKLGDMRSMYADTSGLFWVSKWRALGESVCNFVLNYSLGKMFGIYGIITATIISLFFCNYIWSVQITFKHYFKRSAGEFYLYQLKYSLVNLGICIVTLLICKGVSFLFSGKVIVLCIRAVVCVVIPLLLYYTFYRKTDNYIYCKKLLIKR